MLADYPDITPSAGRLDYEIHMPSSAKLEILGFIAAELPLWRDHPDRNTAVVAENRLTEYLCDHLNSAAYYSNLSHVQFRSETADETCVGRRVDLTVKPRAATIFIEGRRHSQFDSLFPIECKRLPTPKGPTRDSREYVITDPGTTGGMQRFKFGLHGATHKFAAMIAYVQESTFSSCLDEVNGFIRDLASKPNSAWYVSEVLHPVDENTKGGISTFKSELIRVPTLDNLYLRHLWIQMNWIYSLNRSNISNEANAI